MEKIKCAAIIAGGIANRMNEGFFPKSLIPVGNLSPMLYHLFNLQKIGIKNIVILINRKCFFLEETLKNNNQFSMNIDFIEEDEVSNTGGALKKISKKINENFLLISCDTIIEIDYSILIDKFNHSSYLLFKKEIEGKYYFYDKEKLLNVTEQTKEDERFAFAGIGVFERKDLENYFPKDQDNFPLSSVLQKLADKGNLYGQTTTYAIFNLNSYENFCQANDYFLQRENLIEKVCFSKTINTIIFDLDFTLFDSSDIVVDGINYSCEKLQIKKLKREEIYQKTKFKLPRNEVIKLGKILFSEEKKQNQFVDYYYEFIQNKYPKLYPSALELLYFLNSQKFTLGIITSKTRNICIKTLKELKILHLFKEIICYDDVEKPKPNEESFVKICEKLKVNTEDCIYIGDDINDAIPCIKCSMLFFGVTTTLSREDFYPYKQYFIFENLNQIENFFKQLSLFRSYTTRYPNGVKKLILDSESILKKTKNLSQEIQNNMINGMKLLLSADIDSLENMKVLKEEMIIFQNNINKVIKNGKKVHFFGCGSSGRLLVLAERMMRLNKMEEVKNYTFNISGGDTTIPRSFSDFEDNPEYGIRQLKQVGFCDGDMIVTVSGSGTAPFLLDILYYAAQNSSAEHYSIFCNPFDQLKKRCEDSKIFKDMKLNSKINWFSIPSGPMSITGSTRLQATLVMTIVVGCLVMKYDLVKIIDDIIANLQDINFTDLEKLVLEEKNIYERGEKIVYNTYEDLAFITMMDTTERTATFNLSPFKNDFDPISQPYSLCYLHIENTKNSEEAIHKLFLRKPRLLEWDDYPKTKTNYFYGFNFSKFDETIYNNVMDISYENNSQQLIFRYKDRKFSLKCPKDNELVFQMVFKTIINIYSNTVMALMHYYRNNIMTNLTACNTKLIGRICYFIEEFSTFSYHEIARIVFDLVLKLIPGQSIINNCLNYIDFKKYSDELNNKIFNKISMKSFILQKLFKEKISVENIKEIVGGAGDNKYFLIKHPKLYKENNLLIFTNNENYIISYSPENSKKNSNYMKIRKILNKEEIIIPKLYYQDKNETFLILEDCGEVITKFINEDKDFTLQKTIIDILIKFQNIKDDTIKEYPKDLIYSEIKIFLDIFLKEFLKVKLSNKEIEYLEKLFNEISDNLFNLQTKVICHKDFNTSNILYKNNKLYIIDFQSSYKYSRFYDLISFLADDRIDFNKEYYNKGLDYYLKMKNIKDNQDNINNEIKFCILHRNFHTLGLFSKFYLEGKLNYKKSLENSFLILKEFSKDFKIDELLSILNKYPLKFEKNFVNFNKFLVEENLEKELYNHDIIIITGSSSSGKSSLAEYLSNKYDLEKINFDNLLISNMNDTLKQKLNPKDYEYLNKFFNDNLYYYARHYNCENDNPFVKQFIDSHTNDWEKIKDILSKINKELPSGDENKKICLEKINEMIIDNKKSNKKKLLIDIAYASEEQLNLFNKFNSLIIFTYIPITTLMKTIKIRNINSLKKNDPKEYRHIIFVLYSYLNYFKNGKGKLIDEIDNNKFNNIIKEIPSVDPYYLGYHKKKYTNINVLNEFNIPIKCNLLYAKYLAYKNIELILLMDNY